MTAYTAHILDKGCTFKEFALLCARAFGALIEMRDDPMDAPIPEKVEPSRYHANALKQCEADLVRLEGMTEQQRIAYGESEKANRLKSLNERREENKEENRKLYSVLAEVQAWTPPTEDHAGLKKFMIEQIEMSLNTGDYYADSIRDCAKKPAVEFWADEIERVRNSILSHKVGQKEDEHRANKRTEWIKQLRDSLK